MLVLHPRVHFPVIVNWISKSNPGQNIKSEVLSLRSTEIGTAVDPAEAKTAGEVGDNAPVSLHKIVTAAEIDPEMLAG